MADTDGVERPCQQLRSAPGQAAIGFIAVLLAHDPNDTGFRARVVVDRDGLWVSVPPVSHAPTKRPRTFVRGLVFIGSPTWARTRDLRINSPALYRLSYRGTSLKL